MLTGFAFLAALKSDYMDRQAEHGQLHELNPVECPGCGIRYRLFARRSQKLAGEDAQFDIQNLTERAHHAINRDCPSSAPVGSSRKPSHKPTFEFLQSGSR